MTPGPRPKGVGQVEPHAESIGTFYPPRDERETAMSLLPNRRDEEFEMKHESHDGHDGHPVLAEAENMLAEVLLVSAVAAVGLFLTLLASGVAGWAAISGSAAVAMFVSAGLSLRAGKHAAQRHSAPSDSASAAGSKP